MKKKSDSMVYTPGQYGKKHLTVAEWRDAHIQKWAARQAALTSKSSDAKDHPVICFSRKIGGGALEIADILAEKINFRVIDREILEHMASQANLTEKTVAFFDERYPGRMSELLAMLTTEKSFIKSDYARELAKSALALADLEPTIFVGRGLHLILPRERVLAVRCICSQEFREKRLAHQLGIDRKTAQERLSEIDKEQRDFFKRIYQKKDASPYEFDLVINRDYISNPEDAAAVVGCAYERKFNKG
ncbi:Cytidylate kinase [Desulfocicer vacuolatum DSM 3385]|uniref:Cytidylate kinase n=1 Tax=Desulfocicer vacuolatum DSM 3385 TaxID=1121400 RepID=A0A1W2A7K6_9BACT|nr:cytidylate kinase-like family protein [Desulfocicer vacuolatum]SMC56401.1 Cytidylate kinase [Desulfocicer vacuolatum DSM 3385]